MSFEFVCRICGHNKCKKFLVKEMQFGMQDEFDYYECLSCGCLQISEYPENISKYYPDKYFSYGSSSKGKFIKEKLNSYRDKASLGLGNIIGGFLLKNMECQHLSKG